MGCFALLLEDSSNAKVRERGRFPDRYPLEYSRFNAIWFRDSAVEDVCCERLGGDRDIVMSSQFALRLDLGS
jgi:hypothetical protein